MKTKALTVVGILVGLIIVLAWFLFLYKPATDDLAAVNSEIEDAKAEQLALQGELASLEKMKENEADIDAELVYLQQAAPEVSDEEGLIASIQFVATQNTVELPSVTVSEPAPGTDISTLSFQLEVNGTYKNVTNFFAALLDPTVMPRVVTFDQMQITPSKSSSEGDPTATISVTLSGRAFTTQDAGAVPGEGEAAAQAVEGQ